MKDAANFYGNRVIKEFKELFVSPLFFVGFVYEKTIRNRRFLFLSFSFRDKTQVEWVRSFVNALEELRKYIMQYHTTGLTWNPKVSFDGLDSSPPFPH